MLCVVIVLFGFDARIRNVIDFDAYAELFRRRFHHSSQIEHGELLGELVVNAAFALGCGIVASDLDAPDGVTDVEETACLTALAVDRERLADSSLHAESIQHGPKHIV